jgi:hypothetical protein
MKARTILGLTAVLLAGATNLARAGGPVPQAFESLKPYQVVEQIMAFQEVLALSDEQVTRLGDLSAALRTEKHQWTHHQGGKPHSMQHVPMVTKQQAYDQALEILTADQQARLEALFPAPGPEVTPVPAKAAPRKLTAPHGKP